jgi:U3 small nucleolar RNA-associated protein 4
MSTAVPSYILVIDLKGEKPLVLRRFDHHRIQDSMVHNRVLKGRALKGVQDKVKTNGVHVNGDVDTEMAGDESPREEEEQDIGDEEKDSDEDEDEVKKTIAALISVDRIAVSADGQWLATSDNRARTHVFNLDSISVSSFSKSPFILFLTLYF